MRTRCQACWRRPKDPFIGPSTPLGPELHWPSSLRSIKLFTSLVFAKISWLRLPSTGVDVYSLHGPITHLNTTFSFIRSCSSSVSKNLERLCFVWFVEASFFRIRGFGSSREISCLAGNDVLFSPNGPPWPEFRFLDYRFSEICDLWSSRNSY